MDNLEQIKTIETYNTGRKVISGNNPIVVFGRTRGSKGYENNYDVKFLSETKYHTSFNALIPVASKLCADLAALHGLSELDSVYNAAQVIMGWNVTDPIDKLFTAVVAGVEIINQLKEKK